MRLSRPLAAICLLLPLAPLQAKSFENEPITLAGQRFDFNAAPNRPTVILVIRSETDIKHCFRIATALDSRRDSANYLIIADFSRKSILEKIAIKRDANRFFKSEISRNHISMTKTEELLAAFEFRADTQTALVSNDKKILWESPEHFEDIDKLFSATNNSKR